MNFIPNLFWGLWFIFASLLSFYIPAKVILGKFLNEKSLLERITVSFTVGIVLWTLQAFLFGFLHFRNFTYIYILVFLFLFLRKFKISKIKISIPSPKPLTLLVILIFLLGIFGQEIQFFLSGFLTNKGILSLMTDVNDSLWHTAVISELIRRFPPQQPGLSGVILYNYHFLSDLPIAELIKVFHLPLFPTQFQYMNILFSFLLGANAYVLAKTFRFPAVSAVIFLYLQYFSSDIIYILTFFTRRIFEFTVHPLEDGTMFLENPPRALSYIVLLSSLYFLFHYFNNRDKKLGIITILLMASIIGFKVHTAFGIFGGLGLLSLYFLLKKDIKSLILPILTLILSLSIHIPVNKVSGIPFYAPFELSRMFAVQPKLALSNLELARRVYLDAKNSFGVWRMDFLMLGLFFLGQFGIKNLGFIPSKKIFKLLGKEISFFIVGAVTALFIVATFFYQPIGGADIFNFYLAMFLLLGLIASFNLGIIFSKSKFFAAFIVLFILVASLPRWTYEMGVLFNYLGKDRVLFDNYDLASLKFLNDNTPRNSIILVDNRGQADYAYPYVSALSNRDTFLSGQNVLLGHSIPFETRKKIVLEIFTSSKSAVIKKDLRKNKIGYIYLYGNPELSKGLKNINLQLIFSNKRATIYKVLN